MEEKDSKSGETAVKEEKVRPSTPERSSFWVLMPVLWKTPTTEPFHSHRKPPALVFGKERAV